MTKEVQFDVMCKDPDKGYWSLMGTRYRIGEARDLAWMCVYPTKIIRVTKRTTRRTVK